MFFFVNSGCNSPLSSNEYMPPAWGWGGGHLSYDSQPINGVLCLGHVARR